MKTLYLYKSGQLYRKSNSIILKTDEKEFVIPIKEVRQINIFSDIKVNSRFLSLIAKNGIILNFYGYYGNYFGSFYPIKSNNISGNILIAQVLNYHIKENRINIAKEICLAAAYNSKKTLEQYKIVNKKIENYMEKLKLQSNITNIMLYEARIKNEYYSNFNKIMNNKNFEFKTRTRRPPKDNLNSLISFSNTLLYSAILTEIFKTPLDPKISFLHEPFERRFSLSLDIADIFKPIISDRVIFSMVNRNQFNEEDFITKSNGVFLTPIGQKKIIKEFEEKLGQTIINNKLKRKVSYRGFIRLELYKLIKHILEGEKYKAFRVSW